MRPHEVLTASLFLLGCDARLGSMAPSEGMEQARTGTGVSPDIAYGERYTADYMSPFREDPITAGCDPNAPEKLPPARLWRLSAQQFAKTLADALGHVLGNDVELPPDATQKATGFSNDAAANYVTDRWASVYFNEAKRFASAAVDALPPEFGCAVTGSPSPDCVDVFVQHFGQKAFRRPLGSDEIERYRGFFDANAARHDARVASRMTLEAMLQSPHFVYLSEQGVDEAGRRRLTQHELANQLSYWLTDGPPDAQLRALADADSLDDSALSTQAARLLSAQTAREKMYAFSESYLHLDLLTQGAEPVSAEVAEEYRRETRALVDSAFFSGTGGGFSGFLGSNMAFPGPTATAIYGAGASDYSVAALDPMERRGAFSHAALLNVKHGAIHRGLVIREELLCQKLPLPPPGAAAMPEAIEGPDPDATEKERWERIKNSQPSCAGCHALFQPIGAGFDIYDGVGAYREANHAGRPIDAAVTLEYAGDADGDYQSVPDMLGAIAESALGHRCFSQRYVSFAQGRAVDIEGEACALSQVTNTFRDGDGSLEALVLGIVAHPMFAYREAEAE